MKGYLKDNILYEGVTMDNKPEYNPSEPGSVINYEENRSEWDKLLASAPPLPAIGFPEGHEGVVEYEKKLHWGKWIAIPVPEKVASTQPVEPDCAGHKKDVAGISDMKALAEIIGDLHYETLGQLFDCISDKLILDAAKDRAADRIKLANHLEAAGNELQFASIHIESAWQISKPHMKPEPTSALPDKQESEEVVKLKDRIQYCFNVFMPKSVAIDDRKQMAMYEAYHSIMNHLSATTPSTKETGQREAIAFAEWVRDNAEWQLCEWVVKGKKRPLTTAELYQQFLNQPGIQPSDIK